MKDRERTFVLVTCSGISSTGKLTARVAAVLLAKYPDLFEAHYPVAGLKRTPDRELREADGIVVIDGCSDSCALKKISGWGLCPDHHCVATDHGIEKKGMDDPGFHEIELLARVIVGRV